MKKLLFLTWGGGTFDISILEINQVDGDAVFEVKSTNGDTHLGGEDFDLRIVDFLAAEFKKQEGIDLRQDKMALQRLKEGAEKAKHELSESMETEVSLPFITADSSGPKHLSIKLTRSKLEGLVADLIEKVTAPCLTAIKDSKFKKEEIHEVILVGGMTRMPAVQAKVEQIFGRKPSKNVNPDEVVAMGAAIQGGVLKGDIKDVLLLDVTPLSLGIETLGGVMTKLIEKNTTIPSKKSETFSTAADNQPAVNIHVLQGEREFSKDNKTLGRFDLVGIPPAPRGVPQVEVTFDIDANGIVHVSAKDTATNKEQSIKITASSGLSEEEIEKMVKDAELHAEEDKQKAGKVKKRNELDSMIYSVEKELKDNKEKLDKPMIEELEKAVEAAKKNLESDDEPTLTAAVEKLTQASHKVAEHLYKAAAQDAPKGDTGGDPKDTPPNKDKKNDDTIDADYKEV
jgi:molecular chaperone DnaK